MSKFLELSSLIWSVADDVLRGLFKPHLPNSWIDCSKDKTGYEINFTKYFYKYKPLRSVEEITKDLLERESEGLMRGLTELPDLLDRRKGA